jgi:hypothetical protein
MVERSQVGAASVFVLGRQAIKYSNVPSTAGAVKIFVAGFDASAAAMRRSDYHLDRDVRQFACGLKFLEIS